MRSAALLLVPALAGVLLAGCTPAQPGQSSSSQPPTPTLTSPPSSSTLTPTNTAVDLSGWVGQYSFAEVDNDIYGNIYSITAYGISVYQMGDDYFAAITVTKTDAKTRDTLTQSMTALVTGDADNVTLVFNAYVGVNPADFPKYASGDALLEWKRQSDGIVTTWDKMKPQLSDDATTGFYFATPSPSASAPSSSKTK